MMNNTTDLTFLYQFHVIFVHLFVKVNRTDIEFKMTFGYSQKILKFLFVLIMIPYQYG